MGVLFSFPAPREAPVRTQRPQELRRLRVGAREPDREEAVPVDSQLCR